MAPIVKAPALHDRKFDCIRCGENFNLKTSPRCADGVEHQVEKKLFYSPFDSLTVCWKTDRTTPTTDGSGGVIVHAGKNARFGRGVLISTDPEEQIFFETYAGCISRDKWEELHLTKEQLLHDQKAKLDAAQRLIKEQADLLEQVKADTLSRVQAESKSRAEKAEKAAK